LTFIGYKQTNKQTDRQAKFIYRFLKFINYLQLSIFLSPRPTSYFDWGTQCSHENVLSLVLKCLSWVGCLL